MEPKQGLNSVALRLRVTPTGLVIPAKAGIQVFQSPMHADKVFTDRDLQPTPAPLIPAPDRPPATDYRQPPFNREIR